MDDVGVFEHRQALGFIHKAVDEVSILEQLGVQDLYAGVLLAARVIGLIDLGNCPFAQVFDQLVFVYGGPNDRFG